MYAEFLAGIVSQIVILYLKLKDDTIEIITNTENNSMKKLTDSGVIKTLHDTIQKEFDKRNPGYNQANQIPGVMYSYNPVAAFIEFANDSTTPDDGISFELENKELMEHIRNNLSHRVKINYSENLNNDSDKIYLNLKFV